MKNIFIILGNGFSLDFLNFAEKSKKEIDFSNLFANGELVPWPTDNEPGFLSFKHCSNLWTLGARTNMNSTDAIALIEEIITCANCMSNDTRENQSIYMRAYKELVTYIKALFIYYNERIDISRPNLSDWGWAKYLNSLVNDPEINKVHIVTFNYDIILERVLTKLSLDYSISNFETDNKKIIIYKPHGSISFSYKVSKVKDVFEIDYTQDIIGGEISDFNIEYDGLTPLNMINAIIPPAGDSGRLDLKWAHIIKTTIRQAAKGLSSTDELVICGISYWHVDRLEIDSILLNIEPSIENVKVVNPSITNVFNAVMTSMFENVINYNDSIPLVK